MSYNWVLRIFSLIHNRNYHLIKTLFVIINKYIKLEKLIGICVEYSLERKFKFNPKKSLIMNCGFKLNENNQIEIKIDGKLLETKNACKYLGLIITEKNDEHFMMLERFNQVRKSIFSLNSFGMKPVGVNLFIKSFFCNTNCLPNIRNGAI